MMMKRLFLLLGALCCLPFLSMAESNRTQVLKVYNWEEYLDERLIGEFESWYARVTGENIQVEYTTYDTPEHGLEFFIQGFSDIDVLCLPEYLLQRSLRNDMLQPIDTTYFAKDKTPNWMRNTSRFIDAMLQQLTTEQNVRIKNYMVGYLWGVTGVLVNTKYYQPSEVSSWSFLFDPKYKGQIRMKDSSGDICNVLLGYANYDKLQKGETTRKILSTSLTNEAITMLHEMLEQMRPQMSGFEEEIGRKLIADGSDKIAVTWNGDAQWALDNALPGVNLEYVIPKEGTCCWIDCWAIPAKSQNIKAATYWINFLCRPQNSLRNMAETGYTSTIASPEMLSAAIRPEMHENIDVSYFFGPSGKDVAVNPVQYPDIALTKLFMQLQDSGDRQEHLQIIWETIKNQNEADLPTILKAILAMLILFGGIIILAVRRYGHASFKRPSFSRKH